MWLPQSQVAEFSNFLETLMGDKHGVTLPLNGSLSSFTYPEYQEKLLTWPFQTFRPQAFRLWLCCSTVPLNTISFPRGAWHSGVKFPFVSEKHINKFVGAMPALELRYPRYRHLALPSGVDRIKVKERFTQAIKSINQTKLNLYKHQMARLAYELSLQLDQMPLVLVDIESLAKALGFEKSRHAVWHFDNQGLRQDEPSEHWLPKFEDALSYLKQRSDVKDLRQKQPSTNSPLIG